MSLLLGPHFSGILTVAITRYPCCVVPCSPRFPATCFLVSQPRPKNNKALRHCAWLPTHHAANILDCLNTNFDGISLHCLTFFFIFGFKTFAIANNYSHRSPPRHQPHQVSAAPSRAVPASSSRDKTTPPTRGEAHFHSTPNEPTVNAAAQRTNVYKQD